MRAGRFVAIGVVALAVVAAAVIVAPVAGAQQRGIARLAQAAQDRVLTIAPQIQMLTSGGPQIGVTIKDGAKGDGAEVTDVRSGSPASKAGFRSGDVIVEFDGERVRSAAQLTRLVRETPAGRTVKVGVTRDGKRVDLSVAPEDRPGALEQNLSEMENRLQRLPESAPNVVPRFEWRSEPFTVEPFGQFVWPGGTRLGVTVENLTDQLAGYFGAKEGVLVTEVTESSAAAKAGLKAGDVITAIGGKPVRDSSELARAVRDWKEGTDVAIGIVRDRKPQTLTARLEAANPARRIAVRRGIRV